jgi:hypothetical protein
MSKSNAPGWSSRTRISLLLSSKSIDDAWYKFGSYEHEFSVFKAD